MLARVHALEADNAALREACQAWIDYLDPDDAVYSADETALGRADALGIRVVDQGDLPLREGNPDGHGEAPGLFPVWGWVLRLQKCYKSGRSPAYFGPPLTLNQRVVGSSPTRGTLAGKELRQHGVTSEGVVPV